MRHRASRGFSVACRLKAEDRQAQPGGLLLSHDSDKENSRSVSFVIKSDPVRFAEALQHRIDLQSARQ